ncbi:MAG: hypothetical protein QGI24_00835 [Kiritimatiellia bacterium]|jgi:hypothetical protein|nr:hypothetical protein [Kiritimatiellia bacterium]MDP6847306.1 hypothetical protein [Kiritimatiellia bacterium]
MPQFMGRNIVQGVISTVNPLTVKNTQGDIVRIELTDRTTYRRESLAQLSDVTPGITIGVASPPGAGGTRGAGRTGDVGGRGGPGLEIVIRSDSSVPGRRMAPVVQGDESVLLPDLPQQPLSPEFVYAAWLGRGLFTNDELDRGFRVARNIGIKHLKVEFKWGMIELRNNKWNWHNEGKIDVGRVVTLARKYNLAIIPYFNVLMPWGETREPPAEEGALNRPRRGQHQAPDPTEYAEYVFTVVDLLKTSGVDVRYVELDNEVSAKNDGHNCWNLFINITAKELKVAQNAAYDRVKAKYPEIAISSTTFQSPSRPTHLPADMIEQYNERLNSFVKVYFGEKPRPKFDFLAIHEIFQGSGNPYTTWEWKGHEGKDYVFSSYHHIYDIWRDVLDRHDRKNTPIFVTEGTAKFIGKQDAVLVQRIVFAKSQAAKNRVMGWVLSQITASERFAEGRHLARQPGGTGGRQQDAGTRGRGSMQAGGTAGRQQDEGTRGRGAQAGGQSSRPRQALFGSASMKDIVNVANGYAIREGYHAWRTILTTFAKYPVYEDKVRGELNNGGTWIEKFNDGRGNVLYVLFLPYRQGEERTQATVLNVAKANCGVTVTTSQGESKTVQSSPEGKVELLVSEHPLFVEVGTGIRKTAGGSRTGR